MSRSKMGTEAHEKRTMGVKLETLTLAFQTLRVVYCDVGTSPLYTSSTTISSAQEADILGVLSLIFWTLTLIGVVKYTLTVLHADDNGDGNSTVKECSL